MPLLVFCIAVVAVSIPLHWRLRSRQAYVLRTLLTGLAASILFQVAVRIRLGYWDPFAPVALITAAILGCAVAGTTGGIVRLARRRTARREHSDM